MKEFSKKDIISELAGHAPYGHSGYINGAYHLAAILLYPDEDTLREAIDRVAYDVEGYLNDQAELRADAAAKGF